MHFVVHGHTATELIVECADAKKRAERYLEKYSDELSANGYVLCKGKHLKEFKLEFAHLINEASKTTQLASIAL